MSNLLRADKAEFHMLKSAIESMCDDVDSNCRLSATRQAVDNLWSEVDELVFPDKPLRFSGDDEHDAYLDSVAGLLASLRSHLSRLEALVCDAAEQGAEVVCSCSEHTKIKWA